jgi:acyl-CoA thioesterase-2
MLEGLTLEPLAPGQYRAPHVERHGNGWLVFGGQMLAQMVVAAGSTPDVKPLTSFHAVFARPGQLDQPLLIDVDVIANGRNARSAAVTVHQGGPPCVRGLALALTPQPEVGAHALPTPRTDGPDDAEPLPVKLSGVEVRIADGVDLSDPAGGHPPEVHLWMRVPEAPPDPIVAQAMLAYCSEPFFAATGLRPHENMSQAHFYVTIAPAVTSHGVAFHDRSFRASDWLLFAFSSPHTSQGRVFGRADVFDEDGQSVASVWQENLLRPVEPPSAGEGSASAGEGSATDREDSLVDTDSPPT